MLSITLLFSYSRQVNASAVPSTEGIEKYVQEKMKAGKIPGLSLVIVKNNQLFMNQGFGFADVQEKRRVTPDTFFELGSTSKAFTALGILSLEQKGLVSLQDPVTDYLPWFKVKYKGDYKGKRINGDVSITLDQLLHHTSGIPFRSIGGIPPAEDDEALERTVRGLIGTELDFYPGERFLYATINYDILGLIIQKVSHMSFEGYMEENILHRLGLDQTVMFRAKADSREFATGYKLGLMTPVEYNAPMFRGNTPAGYFMMNGRNMAEWLKIQINAVAAGDWADSLIKESHVPDRTVPPDVDGSSYAAGWKVFQTPGGEYSHEGSNPNYSSYIVFRPGDQTAVGVMTNLNSSYTRSIGQGIMEMLAQEEQEAGGTTDLYKSLDQFSTLLIAAAGLFIIGTLLMVGMAVIDLFKGRRKFRRPTGKWVLGITVMLLFLSYFAYCLYLLPEVLFYQLPWSFVKVWAPFSFIPALKILLAAIVLFAFYILVVDNAPRKSEKPFFALVILSSMSGIGNVLIIFTINEALNQIRGIQPGLLMFFSLGIILYIFGQLIIRKRLILLANEAIYQKRKQLTASILNTSYQNMERLEQGKVHAGLNNDTEVISQIPTVVVGCLTDVVTLLCCFAYLGIVNIYGLFISLAVIFAAAGLYFIVGRSADRLWEQTRDIQNTFLSYINDLIMGFKELSLNTRKRRAFETDMGEVSATFISRRSAASLSFMKSFVVGELLFTAVIGTVAFLFPYVFKNIQADTLRTYVFVFLYMTGPVNGVLNQIPNLFQIRVSLKRINRFMHEINEMASPAHEEHDRSEAGPVTSIKLEHLVYQHSGKDASFTVGPIQYEFRAGEITFITGGNGSGKTTLAKLLSGLYRPDSGRILVNNVPVNDRELGSLYSTVFSDFHLFRKMYGIEYEEKEQDARHYLKLLQLEHKLEMHEGVFSTVKELSTGQKKRLALLVSYLEERPILLFDEVAADQDPEFKAVFYEQLLQELKGINKCVIVISHDDRYFHAADRIIKMEAGKIIS
ncbi:cyclic peptide export ABC transporter [Paenibacillus sp. FSL R7-0337]|uniref:cyclic peptide export ABC transporter n=1 Tax=Paenibacillus sp. FSL R7-0337 TaxID=1926588 RepID=UPI0030DB9EA0